MSNQLVSSKTEKRNIVTQGFLCALCTVVGILYPTFLDWSKSTTEVEHVWASEHILQREKPAYPFSPISVVLCNTGLQFFVAICFVKKRGGLSELFADPCIAWKMAPVGFIFAIGELLTLRAVQKGSGPVYVTISNAKLVIVAIMSRVIFGKSRAMPPLHWCELVFISLLASAYTLTEADALGSAWEWDGAWSALAKSFMNSFIAVYCEHAYKSSKLYIVLTLQAMWSLIFIVVMIVVAVSGIAMQNISVELRDDNGAFSFFNGGPDYPLCDSSVHATCISGLPHAAVLAGTSLCKCVRARGWDGSTYPVVLADIANAVTSVLVFKRLNAVAKYMCRAMSALPMYIFYCLSGRSKPSLQAFAIIVALCLQVGVYTVQRQKAEQLAEAEQRDDASWAQHYYKNGAATSDSNESLRKRSAIV